MNKVKKWGGLVLLIAWSISVLSVHSIDKVEQVKIDLFKQIENAFSVGNATTLESILGSSVEIELPGEVEGIYSRSQTIAILNRFFNRFPPATFKIRQTGNSASGAKFAIGDYITESERSFRVTVFVDKHNGNYKIQEIEFE